MESKLFLKHATKLVIVLTGAVVLFFVVRAFGLSTLTEKETEGLNTLILLMGSIYAVMFAFVIFVIWGQFAEVETLAARECSSLKDMLRFGEFLQPDDQRAIRRAISDYSRTVCGSEWESMGRQQKDAEAERAFAKVLKAAVQASPANDVIRSRLIDLGREVGQYRDERVEKSLTRIPPTLLSLVRGMALAVSLLVFAYPFHSAVVGAFCFVLVACVLFCADVVMMDTDNPFSGLCNISPRAFLDLSA